MSDRPYPARGSPHNSQSLLPGGFSNVQWGQALGPLGSVGPEVPDDPTMLPPAPLISSKRCCGISSKPSLPMDWVGSAARRAFYKRAFRVQWIYQIDSLAACRDLAISVNALHASDLSRSDKAVASPVSEAVTTLPTILSADYKIHHTRQCRQR